MINLNNTWCEATEENHDKLTELGLHGDFRFPQVYADILLVNEKFFKFATSYDNKHLHMQQIKLNSNNEFEYVKEEDETENENQAQDKVQKEKSVPLVPQKSKEVNPQCPTNFGFENPDFECEILGIVDNTMIGCIRNGFYKGVLQHATSMSWCKDGKTTIPNNSRYNLTPIKKPWYEALEGNCVKYGFRTDIGGDFPVLIRGYHKGKILISHNLEEVEPYLIRPATKHEVLKLVVEGE